jgi:hypothetical protein
MDDAGVECEGKVLLLFQKSLLLSSSDIIFDFKIGVIDMRNNTHHMHQHEQMTSLLVDMSLFLTYPYQDVYTRHQHRHHPIRMSK